MIGTTALLLAGALTALLAPSVATEGFTCTVNGSAKEAVQHGDRWFLNGTDGPDLIECGDVYGPVVVDGGSGKDSIRVAGYNYGEVDGGLGGDTVWVRERNYGRLHGGSGDDELRVLLVNVGSIDGGPGSDLCSALGGQPAVNCERF